MTQIRSILTRANALAAAGTLVFAAALTAIPAPVSALSLVDRGLMVSSTNPSDDYTAPDGSTYDSLDPGDPRNGGQVSHTYTFTVQTDGNLEGFSFEYCDSAFGYIGTGLTNCDLPTGFSAAAWDGSTVVVDNITQDIQVTYDIDVPVGGGDQYLVFTNATGIAATIGDTIEIVMAADANDYFVNPVDSYRQLAPNNGTYFAHISTFDDDTNANGAFTSATDPVVGVVDEGTVTNNVTQSINIYTRVQETLNFSVEGDANNDGATDAIGATQCDPLTDDPRITLGDPGNDALDPDNTYDAKSYFRIATNASNGTSVYYSGKTLSTSNEANVIDAIGAAAENAAVGEEQFGLTLLNNVADPDHTLASLTPVAAYASTTQYAFDPTSETVPVAFATTNSVIPCETGAIEYIANISVDTEAGVYQTKLNYIAAPSY